MVNLTPDNAISLKAREGVMVKTYYCNPKTQGITYRYKGSAHREIVLHDGPNVRSRSLLLDAFGVDFCPTEICVCENRWVDIAHNEFSKEVMDNLPQDGIWQLEQIDICDWVFDYVARADVLDQQLVTT